MGGGGKLCFQNCQSSPTSGLQANFWWVVKFLKNVFRSNNFASPLAQFAEGNCRSRHGEATLVSGLLTYGMR